MARGDASLTSQLRPTVIGKPMDRDDNFKRLNNQGDEALCQAAIRLSARDSQRYEIARNLFLPLISSNGTPDTFPTILIIKIKICCISYQSKGYLCTRSAELEEATIQLICFAKWIVTSRTHSHSVFTWRRRGC